MGVRIGINGFGKIGRDFLRAVLDANKSGKADIEVVATNDLTSPATNAHLLRYDSVYGKLDVPVEVDGDHMVVGEQKIKVFSQADPGSIPWSSVGVQIVVESTGRFTKREAAAAHLGESVKRVIISAPSGDADGTFVIGVNDHTFDPALHTVISCGSCTTNCFVPMVKVVDDAFGISSGLMTTVHAFTNDQNLLDFAHKDLRRARSAPINIVPTSTGAARATGLVLPAMQGRLNGFAMRVPVPVGSITDFTAVVSKQVSVEEVNAAFKSASESGPLAKVLDYSEDPIVSTDIVGSPASCTFDSPLTMVMPIPAAPELTLVKVQGWYDNEWGYSHRLVDMVGVVSRAENNG